MLQIYLWWWFCPNNQANSRYKKWIYENTRNNTNLVVSRYIKWGWWLVAICISQTPFLQLPITKENNRTWNLKRSESQTNKQTRPIKNRQQRFLVLYVCRTKCDNKLNHNYNKIVKFDCLSTALISALIGQFNRTVHVMPK